MQNEVSTFNINSSENNSKIGFSQSLDRSPIESMPEMKQENACDLNITIREQGSILNNMTNSTGASTFQLQHKDSRGSNLQQDDSHSKTITGNAVSTTYNNSLSNPAENYNFRSFNGNATLASSGSDSNPNAAYSHMSRSTFNIQSGFRPQSVVTQFPQPSAGPSPCRAITGHQNFLPQVISQNPHALNLAINAQKSISQTAVVPRLPPWVKQQIIPNNVGSWNGTSIPNQRRSVPNMTALLQMSKPNIQQPMTNSIPALSFSDHPSSYDHQSSFIQSPYIPPGIYTGNSRLNDQILPYQDSCINYDSMNFQEFECQLRDIIQNQEESHNQFRGKPMRIANPSLASDENIEKSGLPSPQSSVTSQPNSDRIERYSRKVFVGGLPPDIDEEEISAAFSGFGNLVVDWPHKAESKSYFPPKGYCFLLFQDEMSVQLLIQSCFMDLDKLYWCVTSPTMQDKAVQIRPWNLNDSDFVMDGSQTLDPRKTIFVGGVPRPLRAVELAKIMDRLYGGVCYAGIDTDPELKYPKGAGRVAFSNQQSYIAAISARFVQLQHGDIDKRVEVKPYVLDDQMCDECQGSRCAGKFAPFFCASITCLQYYCEHCWAQIHSRQGREFHKPLVKEGADRPRAVPFRWC